MPDRTPVAFRCLLLALASTWMASQAAAQTVPAVEPSRTTAAHQADDADEPLPDDPTARRWEGAIGVTAAYGPAYPGSDEYGARLTPGFLLRYGSFTFTNASGFITKRAEPVARGLSLDVRPTEALRLNVALRIDNGRNDGGADALEGLGDIDATLRVRVGANWRLPDRWRLNASLNLDALGQGGGNFGELGFARDERLSPATVWTWGGSVGLGARKYMQSYFGVTAEQAARTGYAVYTPSAGLRDVSAYASLRTELNEDWILLAGVGVSRVLGPVADSPLNRQANGFGLNGGLAWRF